MKFELNYWEILLGISVLWVLVRAAVALKRGRFSFVGELKMLLVYICLIVIARLVYFPLHHVDGRIGVLRFDSAEICPPWVNLVPLVHLFDRYDGWLTNIIGNIAMFIPVGLVWPICFKKLDNLGKTVLAGFGLTLFIELSQLLFYERNSDVDDLLLNTLGAFLGALIVFGIRRLSERQAKK